MTPNALHLDDWHRVLVGNNPSLFLVETLLRACVIYLLLLLAMRLMGRRIGAQLTQNELAVVVSLGAAIGVPMQTPERGLLPAVVIRGVAICVQRGLNRLTLRHGLIEHLLLGTVLPLVEDGRMLLPSLRHTRLSRERLFAILRGRGFQHLGQLRRVYFESSGEVSVLPSREPRPGLCILPAADTAMRQRSAAPPRLWACSSCGHVSESDAQPQRPCEHCAQEAWERAFTSVDGPTS